MLRVFGYNSFLPLQDGTCIIHTARKGEYVVTLRPTGMSPGAQDSFCHVTGLALSEYGNIVVCYQQENSRSLCRYSINGKLLTKDVKLKEDVARVFISGEFVVIGGADGKLEIRKLQGYENLIMYIVTVFFCNYLFLHSVIFSLGFVTYLGIGFVYFLSLVIFVYFFHNFCRKLPLDQSLRSFNYYSPF